MRRTVDIPVLLFRCHLALVTAAWGTVAAAADASQDMTVVTTASSNAMAICYRLASQDAQRDTRFQLAQSREPSCCGSCTFTGGGDGCLITYSDGTQSCSPCSQ